MKVEDVVQESFEVFKENWLSLILATIIAAIGSVVTLFILAPPLFFGLYAMAMRAVEGESIEASDVFKGFSYFGTSWVMAIVGFVAVSIGLILLIIPGLLLMVLFTYAVPLAIRGKLGGIDALQKSYNMGKENFEFTLILAFVLWVINAIGSALQVGFLISVPFSALCISIATIKLTEKEGKTEKEEKPEATGAPEAEKTESAEHETEEEKPEKH